MVDSAPEIAELAVDLHERLIQMPPPLRIPAHVRHPLFSDLGGKHRAAPQGAQAAPPAPQGPTPKAEETVFPLGMVLDACPDIADYAKGGIVNWRDFVATAALIRSMLGVSPSAWEEAVDVMGERRTAIVVAAILQRGDAISSAGGYLRDLTRKAQAGRFTLGPMLMALIGRRKREKKRA